MLPLCLLSFPGKITGADYKLYKNAGWGSDASPDVMATAMVQLDNSYEFPSFRVNSKVCKTNTPSNTAFRAFGAPPAMTITENMIYDACVELNLDPLQFRRDNLQKAGWENHYGQVIIVLIIIILIQLWAGDGRERRGDERLS